MTERETANARVAVTRTTHQRLRDFSHGLGVSQDDAVNLLLDLVMKAGEDPLISGRRLREKLKSAARHAHAGTEDTPDEAATG